MQLHLLGRTSLIQTEVIIFFIYKINGIRNLVLAYQFVCWIEPMKICILSWAYEISLFSLENMS